MSPTDFATCDLCDAHKTDTDGAFRVLPPVCHDYGARRKAPVPAGFRRRFAADSPTPD